RRVVRRTGVSPIRRSTGAGSLRRTAMSDYMLFAVLPYAAALGCLAGAVVRAAQGTPTTSAAPRRPLQRIHVGIIASALGVAAGHLLLLLALDLVLRWNRSVARLLTAEGTGIALGLVCLAAIVPVIRRQFSASRAEAYPLGDVATTTLVAI